MFFTRKTVWDDPKYSANVSGTQLLAQILKSAFTFPKSFFLVKDCIKACEQTNNGIILDYYAGSGTTGHAVIDLNRKDNGKRKYILVEMGEYFDSVTKPRMQKVVYSADWKDGKPLNRNTGVSQIIKYLRLESYEDAQRRLRRMGSFPPGAGPVDPRAAAYAGSLGGSGALKGRMGPARSAPGAGAAEDTDEFFSAAGDL